MTSWPTGPSFYLLCANPRVGSSLWAQVLRSTGRLGDPIEPFHFAAEAELREEWGLVGAPYHEFLAVALDRSRTPNGTGGTKLMWVYHDLFLERLAGTEGLAHLADGVDRFAAVFDGSRAIHLTRRDKVRGAISNWLALATDQWVLYPGIEAAALPVLVDVWAITRLHAELHAAAVGWPRFLTAAGIPHETVFYEDWSQQPRVEAARISRAVLHVDIDADDIPDPQLMVQSTPLTDEAEAIWTARTGGCKECQG